MKEYIVTIAISGTANAATVHFLFIRTRQYSRRSSGSASISSSSLYFSIAVLSLPEALGDDDHIALLELDIAFLSLDDIAEVDLHLGLFPGPPVYSLEPDPRLLGPIRQPARLPDSLEKRDSLRHLDLDLPRVPHRPEDIHADHLVHRP